MTPVVPVALMIAASHPATSIAAPGQPGVMVAVKAAKIPVSPAGRPARPVVGLKVPVRTALVMLSPKRLQPAPLQSTSPAASLRRKMSLAKRELDREVKFTVKLLIVIDSRVEMGKSGVKGTRPSQVCYIELSCGCVNRVVAQYPNANLIRGRYRAQTGD